MPYTAIMNVPGYLPWSDDEPPVFDTASDAWSYLAQERREQEEITGDEVFTSTADDLDAHASAGLPGTVYGCTPGYDGGHDLGIAYTVAETEN